MEELRKRIEIYLKQLEKLFNSKSHFFNSVKRKDIPDRSGIYAIFKNNSDLLYIGVSKDLGKRILGDHLRSDITGSAFRKNLSEYYNLGSEKKIKEYILKNCYFKFMTLENPNHLEHFLISVLKPQLNK